MRKKFLTLGIAIGWGLGVILGTFGIESALTWGRRQTEELVQAQDRLRRLRGWLDAEEQVRTGREEILGPFAHAAQAELDWVMLQGLQQAAAAQGVSVTDLRPSQVSGQGPQPPILRLDARLEGSLEQISGLLEKLPDAIPGVRLEGIQLIPQEEGKVRGILRLKR